MDQEVESLMRAVADQGHNLDLGEPQSDASIATLEQALGVGLPPSYRAFLKTLGSAMIYDSVVSGIHGDEPLGDGTGWIYGDTLIHREEYNLPPYLLVIQPDPEAPYCLDTRSPRDDGELPIVCFELHSGHEKTIASSFLEWFKNWYLRPYAESKDDK